MELRALLQGFGQGFAEVLGNRHQNELIEFDPALCHGTTADGHLMLESPQRVLHPEAADRTERLGHFVLILQTPNFGRRLFLQLTNQLIPRNHGEPTTFQTQVNFFAKYRLGHRRRQVFEHGSRCGRLLSRLDAPFNLF